MKAADFEWLSARDAVLLRPDVYVGSTESVETVTHLFDGEQFAKRVYALNPVYLKIFDEIVTNALDASVRDAEVRKISVALGEDGRCITVTNDGTGIPIVEFGETSRTVPEVIFSELHSGSSFKDSGVRTTGGRNGLGAVLTNIWSSTFSVEIVDPVHGKTLTQTFRDNMSECGSASVTALACKRGKVCVSYVPDYKRLKVDPAQDFLVDLLRTRTLEVAACARKGVAVDFNGCVLPASFGKYAQLVAGIGPEAVVEEVFGGPLFGMSVAVAPRAPDGAELSAFVNGVRCGSGTHVRGVYDRLVKLISDAVKKRFPREDVKVKASTVREKCAVVISATVGDPTFSSQTKENLTLPFRSFGFATEFSPRFIAKLSKSTIVSAVYESDASSNLASSLRKTKTKAASFIDKYDAAIECARHPSKCTLILTEGDSAKTMAVAGLGSAGRTFFGLFPLRGVLINARNIARQKVFENAEVANIMKILNIQPGRVDGLRYGSVAIFTDADYDGVHIAALIVNFFAVVFPELLARAGFLKRILSPIIRVKHNRSGQELSFLTAAAFEEWSDANDVGAHEIRYIKGLGGNSSKEAKALFEPSEFDRNLLRLYYVDATTDTALCDFFSDLPQHILARKRIIASYDSRAGLDLTEMRASVDDFLYKDLVHFSSYSVHRAIPSALDGCTPSRRKALFYFLPGAGAAGRFEKVAQAAANCAAQTQYHHGEASLIETVVGLAQDFVGSGNAPLLEGRGQFGSRLLGGKDHAAARYIFTRASPLGRALYHPDDSPLYVYRIDEGCSVEPIQYVPIVPVVLLNGAAGIGTGYATTIPCFSLKSLCLACRSLMGTAPFPELLPEYVGFRGTIFELPSSSSTTLVSKSYATTGSFERSPDGRTLRVTELPVGRWTEAALTEYKSVADGSRKGRLIPTNIVNRSSDVAVDIELTFSETIVDVGDDEIVKALRLRTTLTTSNMYLFDEKGSLRRFATPEEICRLHAKSRLALYNKRKAHQTEAFQIKRGVLADKSKFVGLVIEGAFVLSGRPRAELVLELEAQGFSAKVSSKGKVPSHEHLLSLSLNCFTSEAIAKMHAEIAEMERKLETLARTSAEEMWESDLRGLEALYARHESEVAERSLAVQPVACSPAAIKRTKMSASAAASRPTKRPAEEKTTRGSRSAASKRNRESATAVDF
jgi:DNA topoisomerase-2